MKRFPQKPIRFDEGELKTDLGENNFIFVGSSCDMFADNIPEEWIKNTLNHCSKYDNKYLLQTKNPIRLGNYLQYMNNVIFCSTIETNKFYPQMNNAPKPIDRMYGIQSLSLNNPEFYITIEPIMDFDLKEFVEMIKQCNPIQVNIGADSGNNHLPEPPKDKLLSLIEQLSQFTTIHRKNNLRRLLK
jgi:DNA repair photolyase